MPGLRSDEARPDGMPQDRSQRDGFGYPWTPYRIEWRPTYGPHTRDELLRVLDALAECGVQAWWYSVATKGSYPLFPSRHLPYRPDASPDLYPWLAEQAHARGIALFSWEYLNTAPMLAAQHPEWRFRYIGWDGPWSPRDHHYVCYNSPYGDLLKDYCVEVVTDLGLDGIWFDGSYVFNPDHMKLACVCEFCAAKYRDATGDDMPTRVDTRDPGFRRFIEWRYEDFTAYWRDLSAFVRDRAPRAMVAFNYFNRLYHGWNCASPLRRMPMAGMIATECDGQARLQHKVLRALNDNYPTEVWMGALDGVGNTPAMRPDPDATFLIFHGQLSATMGGFASFGMGNPTEYKHTLKAVTAALDPIAPYVGGDPVPCVGLVLSGATKDYAHCHDPIDTWQTDPALNWSHYAYQAYRSQDIRCWQSVVGMDNLLASLHLPTDVLLDNMLTDQFLSRHPAVVLPDVSCISDASADAIRQYVQRGGCLLALGQTGTKTELGEPRTRGVFDDLFGITWRDHASVPLVMDTRAERLTGDGLPVRYMISGQGRLVRVAGPDVLAEATYQPRPTERTWSPTGLTRPPTEAVHGAAIVEAHPGRGHAILVVQDVGQGYAPNPNRRSREVIRRLLEPHIERPFQTDAPPNVIVKPWRQGDRLVFHLLNMPATLLALRTDVYQEGMARPEDVTPTGPIRITVRGRYRTATSPTHPDGVAFTPGGDVSEVVLDRLVQHAVVALD